MVYSFESSTLHCTQWGKAYIQLLSHANTFLDSPRTLSKSEDHINFDLLLTLQKPGDLCSLCSWEPDFIWSTTSWVSNLFSLIMIPETVDCRIFMVGEISQLDVVHRCHDLTHAFWKICRTSLHAFPCWMLLTCCHGDKNIAIKKVIIFCYLMFSKIVIAHFIISKW